MKIKLTQEQLLKKLKELALKEEPRSTVVYTGSEGAKNFNRLMLLVAVKASARDLHNEGIIDDTELERLMGMIDSPDQESYELAKSIINSYR